MTICINIFYSQTLYLISYFLCLEYKIKWKRKKCPSVFFPSVSSAGFRRASSASSGFWLWVGVGVGVKWGVGIDSILFCVVYIHYTLWELDGTELHGWIGRKEAVGSSPNRRHILSISWSRQIYAIGWKTKIPLTLLPLLNWTSTLSSPWFFYFGFIRARQLVSSFLSTELLGCRRSRVSVSFLCRGTQGVSGHRPNSGTSFSRTSQRSTGCTRIFRGLPL